VNGATVTITLDNGNPNYVYSDTSNYPAFTGFVSDTPIASMTLVSSNWVTMDPLIVGAPEPATLGLMGLGLAGLVARRKRK